MTARPWGPWTLDPVRLDLLHGDTAYRLPLLRLREPADVVRALDEIGRSFPGTEDLGGALRAVLDLVAPAASMIGRPSRLSEGDVRALVARAPARLLRDRRGAVSVLQPGVYLVAPEGDF